jgi:hypothetical protein
MPPKCIISNEEIQLSVCLFAAKCEFDTLTVIFNKILDGLVSVLHIIRIGVGLDHLTTLMVTSTTSSCRNASGTANSMGAGCYLSNTKLPLAVAQYVVVRILALRYSFPVRRGWYGYRYGFGYGYAGNASVDDSENRLEQTNRVNYYIIHLDNWIRGNLYFTNCFVSNTLTHLIYIH